MIGSQIAAAAAAAAAVTNQTQIASTGQMPCPLLTTNHP